jgi:hypothetical protein
MRGKFKNSFKMASIKRERVVDMSAKKVSPPNKKALDEGKALVERTDPPASGAVFYDSEIQTPTKLKSDNVAPQVISKIEFFIYKRFLQRFLQPAREEGGRRSPLISMKALNGQNSLQQWMPKRCQLLKDILIWASSKRHQI